MLKLVDVSKFYSENGVVSAGFTKVNLEFNIGEFVAITGESGSGKSTLLNVISGLDSFEEGEMYMNGKPTSGYTKEELEGYRKEYIGNIFQTFNLINSYNVYQNVELILLMSGYDKKEIPGRVKEIIEKVGLTEYEKTKASKLSGGQKQRVAIARALAKETPVIVADEPTGNLDSKSAEGIIELLHDLSKDKLVIIVTHNYDQVEKYVTRKISMHDGRVAEDKKFNKTIESEDNLEESIKPAKADNLAFSKMVRLSIRNTFNIPSKFVLLLVVFLFLCLGTIGGYSSFLNVDEAGSGTGYSEFFKNTSKERIVISKPDKSEFTEEDYEKINKLSNIERVVENDLFLDSVGSISTEGEADYSYYFNIKMEDASLYDGQLVEGRMPEKKNEAVLMINKEMYDQEYMESQKVLDSKPRLTDDYTGLDILDGKVKIVGYGFLTEDQYTSMNASNNWYDGMLGLSEAGLNAVRSKMLANSYCKQEITFDGGIIDGSYYPIITSKNVPKGQIYIPEDLAYRNSETYAIGKELKIKNTSIYFEDTYKFSVGAVFTEYTFNYYLNRNDFDEYGSNIFMNPSDYKKMFNKGNFQSSVLMGDTKLADETVSSLEDAGFTAFRVSDGLVTYDEGYQIILGIIRTIMLVVVLVVLFFITYFITKLVLKSRNTYYTTVRMIGGTKKNCKAMLRTELFFVFNIAYVICIIGAVLVNKEIIPIEYLHQVVTFLEVKDYAILYVLLCCMSLLLATRYARQLFKKSAMKAHKEEV